jgi:hypothetical protein
MKTTTHKYINKIFSRRRFMKTILSGIVLTALFALSANAATIRVGKTGADFTTIQAAVNAAISGDVILIIDNATYNEQVTIDDTKSYITLISNAPTSPTKPVILWQDKANVGPRTYRESLNDSTITFEKNGALRILGAHNVIIDGISIDGGGTYIFGYPSIWNQKDPLQHGNTGIVLLRAGSIIIRNCDISNAYLGLYFKDRNSGGIFAMQNPSDNDTSPFVPLSGFALTGNHILEYNRIHNNSFGMFFESTWDLGSTIRYNLIYENHHATEKLAADVKALTSDGNNHPGGAFFFKDHLLSPLAIYNNTLYRNNLIFVGHWRIGYQHLVFNNIFGKPYKYWSDVENTFGNLGSSMEVTPCMPNRINNCIFACQSFSPPVSYINIMNGMPQLQGTGGLSPEPGTILSGSVGTILWSATSNNRWLEMEDSLFLSVNSASANFLEPNWNNDFVKQFVSHKGWENCGIKNTDGTVADIGAIEQAHGKFSEVAAIKPTMPIMVKDSGASVSIAFNLEVQIPQTGGVITDPTITKMLYRFVKLPYDPQKDPFGQDGKPQYVILAKDMTDLTPAPAPVKLGPNSFGVTVPTPGTFAMVEMFIEGKGADGKLFTTSAGFLPYRKLEYAFSVQILDTAMQKKLDTVKAGEPVVLRLIPQKFPDSTVFTSKLMSTIATLQSGFPILTSENPAVELRYMTGITGQDDKRVIFTKVPIGGMDNITASGTWRNTSTNATLALLGTKNIFIIANTPEKLSFQDQTSKWVVINPTVSETGNWFKSIISPRDKFGNKVVCKTSAIVKNLSPSIGTIVAASDTIPIDSGDGAITIKLTPAAHERDSILLQERLIDKNNYDTVVFIIGNSAIVAVKAPLVHSKITGLNDGREVLVTCFDLQGRTLFRKSFSGTSSSEIVRSMRQWKGAFSSKVFLMEMITNDQVSRKQLRTVQKIVVR